MIAPRSYSILISPDDNVMQAINHQLEYARKAYNICLEKKVSTYRNENISLGLEDLFHFITDPNNVLSSHFMGNANKTVIYEKLTDQHQLFIRFFSGKSRFPVFLSWQKKQSIRFTGENIAAFYRNDGCNTLKLNDIGVITFSHSEPLPNSPQTITISKTRSNRYYLGLNY